MNLRCIKSFLVGFLFIAPFWCFGQFHSFREQQPFLMHLEKERLFNERIFLLSQLKDSSFSTLINLEKAWSYHAFGKLELSKSYYEQVPLDSVLHYDFQSDYLGMLYKKDEVIKVSSLLSSPALKKKGNLEDFNMGLNFLSMNIPIKEVGVMDIPDKLKNVYRKNLNIRKKSPVLAGLYSIAIPGLGKAYYGKKHEALNAFAANLFFGIQAYESYRKAGTGSARFIFFGTGFSLFYLSNIYGSIAGLVKSKKDWKKQLYYEVGHRYFNTDHVVHPAYH